MPGRFLSVTWVLFNVVPRSILQLGLLSRFGEHTCQLPTKLSPTTKLGSSPKRVQADRPLSSIMYVGTLAATVFGAFYGRLSSET